MLDMTCHPDVFAHAGLCPSNHNVKRKSLDQGETVLHPSQMIEMHLITPGAGIMEVDDRQVTTVQPSFSIGIRQTEYHEALPSLANEQSHLTSSFADDVNAS